MEIALHNLHSTDVGAFTVSTALFSRRMETVLLVNDESIPEALRELSDYPRDSYSFEDAQDAHNEMVEEVRAFLAAHKRVVSYVPITDDDES